MSRRAECYDEESRVQRCCEELRRRLQQLNEAAADLLRDHLRAALDNVLAGMRLASLLYLTLLYHTTRHYTTSCNAYCRILICFFKFRYFRLQSDGPKVEEVSAKNPLVPR